MTNEEYDMLGQYYKKVDNLVWKHFNPDCTETCDCTERMALDYLEIDLVALLRDGFNLDDVKAEVEKAISKIAEENHLDNSIKAQLIINIPWDKIERKAEVVKDFYSAFKTVKSGSQLSGVLNYRLSAVELSKLAKLHKSNKCRRKIEELLESCNFHVECSDFISKRYDKYILVSERSA